MGYLANQPGPSHDGKCFSGPQNGCLGKVIKVGNTPYHVQNLEDREFSKGKSTAIKVKKVVHSSRTFGQSKLSIGKINRRIQLSYFSNDDSMSTGEDTLGYLANRPGPSYDDCLVAKSPLGQSSINSYELYVDLGSGIKVGNTPYYVQDLE
ncbi:hypothetical protein QYF36_023207 [Acer negundo]|nr:hypothetical protein QYF36_023207 [Acer negundo]